MLIGILQTGHAPDSLSAGFGEYPEMFEKLLAGRGLTFASYAVVDGEFPPSVHAAEGWLLTGSRHGAYDDLPFIAPLETFIRDARDAHVPMVGVCFGHQIMAQALGGRVEKFPGGWVVGPQTYDFGGTPIRLNAWHQDQITEPPPGAQVVGQNPGCAYAALLYDDWGYSVQAHPEYSDAFIEGLIETRGRGVVPADLSTAAQRAMGAPNDSSAIADRIAAFFLQHRNRS